MKGRRLLLRHRRQSMNVALFVRTFLAIMPPHSMLSFMIASRPNRFHSLLPGSRVSWLFPVLVVFAVHTPAVGQVLTSEERGEVHRILEKGYGALAAGSKDVHTLFERSIALDPANVQARRQLGSIYLAAARIEDALHQFAIANILLPSDTTRLQIAYLLQRLKRNKESLGFFSLARNSSDPSIGQRARAAAIMLSEAACAESVPWWGKIYAAPYYDHRFENTILSGSLHIGYALESRKQISLFGMVSATRDTRSTGGAIPVIFSDSYALAAGGIRVQPLTGFTADLQAGVAVNLIDKEGEKRTREDFRALLFYGAGLFPDLTVPDHVRFPFTPLADAYASAGYYSRYKNTIGYTQARIGVRALEWGYSIADLYLRGDFGWDTEREFYNNIAEVSIGGRWTPYWPLGLSVLAEYHRGKYWDNGIPTGTFDRYYSSFRVFLVFDKNLCF